MSVDALSRAGPSDGDSADGSSRWTRRTATLSGIAQLIFGLFFIVSSEIGSIRAHSPWGGDPWDAIMTVALLTSAAVGFVTFARDQRWRHVAAMPSQAIRQVQRGTAVVLVAIAAGTATAIGALVTGTDRAAWDGSLGVLLALMIAVSVATLVTAASLALAARSTRPGRSDPRPSDIGDALDDLLSLQRHYGERLPGALGRWSRAASFAMERFVADSPRSPRRGPWRFATIVALGFAGLLSLWHSVAEVGATDATSAILVFVAYAGITALLGLIGYGLLEGYLELIRRTTVPDDRSLDGDIIRAGGRR